MLSDGSMFSDGSRGRCGKAYGLCVKRCGDSGGTTTGFGRRRMSSTGEPRPDSDSRILGHALLLPRAASGSGDMVLQTPMTGTGAMS